MTIPAKANLSYEEAYQRLEEAVAALSTGGLSLEEALARYEVGIALANYCSTLLDRAELRVQQVGQLAPEELEALIDGGSPGPAEAAAAPLGTGANGSAIAPAGRSVLAGPPPAPAATPARGPLAGPLPGARRGAAPPPGPPRKPGPGEPLDPLFDDI